MPANELIKDICKKVPPFVSLYNARVRHYVVKQHVLNVCNQFEKYFRINFGNSDLEWFRLFLLLHDIGKSTAYKKGTKESQFIESIFLIDKYRSELDISAEMNIIFKALLSANSLGRYIESKVPLNDAYNNILEQSKTTNLPLDRFFYILSVYYQCDVASYTKDAGGFPYLEHLFEYQNGEKVLDKQTNLLKLTKVYVERYNLLFAKIKKSSEIENDKNEMIILTKDCNLKIIGIIDLSKFEKPKKEIVTFKENIYIIDTNVFVDYPEIISKIDNKYSIVLSAKVIDELDYLKIKLTEEQKKNVHKALKLINDSMDKRKLKMDMADLTLLPDDFNKKSPDNFILAVALKYKIENPIMLTSDNGLQIKAKGLGITTLTLKDFLRQLKHT